MPVPSFDDVAFSEYVDKSYEVRRLKIELINGDA